MSVRSIVLISHTNPSEASPLRVERIRPERRAGGAQICEQAGFDRVLIGPASHIF